MKKKYLWAVLKNITALSTSLFLISAVTGCMNPCPSPEARERARVVLEETSPRNMNDHPKVTCPNVGYIFPDDGTRGRAEIYNQRLCDDDQ